MQSQIESKLQPQMSQPAAQLSVQRFLIGAIAALSTVIGEASFSLAQAASLTNWSFDPAVSQLEITVKDGTTPRYFLMAQPARIVVDLPGTAIGNVSAQKTYAGPVRQIRVSQFEPGLTRIVMEISSGVSLAPGQVELQKVGDRATQAGNSRWVLRPLVTKSLAANTVAVKPSSVQPLRPIAPSANPIKPPKPLPPAASAPLDRSPTQQKPAAIESNLPSPPPLESKIPTATNGAMDGSNDKPTVSTTAAPTAPVALAPALPASPTQMEARTPLPPTVNPIDPNMAIDTSAGVAIAVPSPVVMPSPKVIPETAAPQAAVPQAVPSPVASPLVKVTPQTAAPQIAAIAARPANLTPRSTAIIEPSPSEPSRIQAPSNTRPLAAAKPASTATLASATIPDTSAAADIPVTLAARPLAAAPSVSVPPLSDRVQKNQGTAPASRSSPIVPEQPIEAASEALPALPAISTSQPSVSVPPPIRVGTPALGIANTAQPRVDAALPSPSLDPALSSVTVPPLQNPPPLQRTTAPSTTPLPGGDRSYDANTIRQAPTLMPPEAAGISYDADTIRQQPSSTANLAPPLEPAPPQPPATQLTTPAYDANSVRQTATSSAASPIVNFGQPLPATPSAARVSGQPLALVNQSPGVRQAFKPTAPNVLLPAGTSFSLRYPGNSALSLRTDRSQQEVLMLQTDLRDISGSLLAPAGSVVTGRFETTTAGSQFVTQSIAVAGRSLPLVAQSEALNGTRQIAGNDLARNSGIGVLAGGVLGAISGSTGLGAIGGAAAGAAATFITAPKPAMIQPGQLIQVRLTQDLSR